jgi:hypothetical protein
MPSYQRGFFPMPSIIGHPSEDEPLAQPLGRAVCPTTLSRPTPRPVGTFPGVTNACDAGSPSPAEDLARAGREPVTAEGVIR